MVGARPKLETLYDVFVNVCSKYKGVRKESGEVVRTECYLRKIHMHAVSTE